MFDDDIHFVSIAVPPEIEIARFGPVALRFYQLGNNEVLEDIPPQRVRFHLFRRSDAKQP